MVIITIQSDTHSDKLPISISVAPPFSGLQRFPDGRGFSQWTGDDLKALMKVIAFLSLRVTHFIPLSGLSTCPRGACVRRHDMHIPCISGHLLHCS